MSKFIAKFSYMTVSLGACTGKDALGLLLPEGLNPSGKSTALWLGGLAPNTGVAFNVLLRVRPPTADDALGLLVTAGANPGGKFSTFMLLELPPIANDGLGVLVRLLPPTADDGF